MQKIILLLLFLIITNLALAISYSDAQFCLDKELWQILDKHATELQDSALVMPSDVKWLKLYQMYAENKQDSLAVLNCMQKLALQHKDFDQAIMWYSQASLFSVMHPDYPAQTISDDIYNTFTEEADHLLLKAYRDTANADNEDSLYTAIAHLKHYNSYIEDLAKALLDMISTERDDSLSFALTEKFYQSFPYSKWRQAVYYFELAHYIGLKDYPAALDIIDKKALLTPAHTYLSTLFLLSPTLRRTLNDPAKPNVMLSQAIDLLDGIPVTNDTMLVLYDAYTPAHWQARVSLQKIKALYYMLVRNYGYYGDEDSLLFVMKSPDDSWSAINTFLFGVNFENNDTGEQAELAFWKGKLYALQSDETYLKQAAAYFIDCLSYGSPRKKYDGEAYNYLAKIHARLKIKTDVMTWARQLKNYNGITFKDITISAGFTDNREARIAIGDYNADSYADILLSGRRMYKNNGNLTFTEETSPLGMDSLRANGGLFADFNKDGKLDFMTTSNQEDGSGERLMKNMGNSFAIVNERAGEVDDKVPTEGAAWIDCFHDGYPDLYIANYEKWQVQNGYEDKFWSNDKGYFSDETSLYGFLLPSYTRDPGQAGRGVAPADFDNDGDQEIYVTNYRLDRNFLWDRQDTTFVDNAALDGVQGVNKKGYYGHSIGADWGDFDNDGDLDLFVANLAHPRFMDISDLSMLLRNDGPASRNIDGDVVTYWKFTDIARQAGITYDELHSDPMWFDADNDGLLDLFITSVYENERSYLYHNNGNGTFTDVTWLAGARVYNGWGNACTDLNHDGKLELVVGSGSLTKVLLNSTSNLNKSMIFKPIWEGKKVSLISSYPAMKKQPNTPAFGSRVILTLKRPDGSKYSLIRELSSAKGTTSQSEQIIHFGISKNKVVDYKLFQPQNP